MARRFAAFFSLDGYSPGSAGIEVEWEDVDRILGRIQRDYAMRLSYVVTSKELYERERVEMVSAEEGDV